jgi:hypothetical protein
VTCCNILCGISEMVCIPVHFCLKYIVSAFERPYSFCFISNFFLLITPTLLLLIILIQLPDLNENYEKFHFIIGFLLSNLLLNFAVTFYIYYLYGIHKIQKEKEQTYLDVGLYTKYVFNYVTHETLLAFVIVYYFGQIVAIIICLNWISNSELNSKYEGLIVLDFTKFAVICNALFIFINSSLYTYLFLVLICKINYSCFCNILSRACDRVPRTNISEPVPGKDLEIREDEVFVHKSLRFFKFLGIYDVEKAFPKKVENVINIGNE